MLKWQTRSSHLIIYNPNLFKVNLDSFFLCQWNTLTALFFPWFFLAPLDVLTTIIPLHRILTATEHSAQDPWTGASQVNFGTRWKLSHQRVSLSSMSFIEQQYLSSKALYLCLASKDFFRHLSWYFSLTLHKSVSAHFYLKIQTLGLLF